MQVICDKYKKCKVNCYHSKEHEKSNGCEKILWQAFPEHQSENCGKCTVNGLRLKKLKKLNKIKNASNL